MALGLGFAPGCSSDDDDNADAGTGGRGGTGGTGGSTGGTGGSTGGTGGSTGGTGGSTGGTGGGDGGAAVLYRQVKPIFMTRCLPCHTPGGTGATYHTLADSIADAKKNSYSCPGKTKGACTLDRIKAGTMPMGKGCTGNPAMDVSKTGCLTQEEQDTLAGWIAGGLQE